MLGPLTAAFGFVGGATKGNTANLFHVSVNDVNWKMQAISSCMEGVLNLGYAFFIDIFNDVCIQLYNIDFLHYLAAIIYQTICNDEELDEFNVAKDKFEADYQAANEKNIAETGHGLSFDAYNDAHNKSLGSKIGDSFTGGMTTDKDGNMVYKTGIIKNVGNFFGIGVNDPRGISDIKDRLNKSLTEKDLAKIESNMLDRLNNGKLSESEYSKIGRASGRDRVLRLVYS